MDIGLLTIFFRQNLQKIADFLITEAYFDSFSQENEEEISEIPDIGGSELVFPVNGKHRCFPTVFFLHQVRELQKVAESLAEPAYV